MTFKIEDAARTKEGGNNDMKVKTSVAKKRNTEQRLFKNQFTNEMKSACLKKKGLVIDDLMAKQRAVLS